MSVQIVLISRFPWPSVARGCGIAQPGFRICVSGWAVISKDQGVIRTFLEVK